MWRGVFQIRTINLRPHWFMNPARTGRGASNHRTHTTMKNAASASVPATPPNRFILGLVDMIKRERSIVFDEGNLVIGDIQLFATDVLPKYFNYANVSSFQRQLRKYSFRKISKGESVVFYNSALHGYALTKILELRPRVAGTAAGASGAVCDQPRSKYTGLHPGDSAARSFQKAPAPSPPPAVSLTGFSAIKTRLRRGRAASVAAITSAPGGGESGRTVVAAIGGACAPENDGSSDGGWSSSACQERARLNFCGWQGPRWHKRGRGAGGGGFRGGGHGDGSVRGWEAPTERDLDGKRRSNRGSSSGGGFRGGGHGDGSVRGWEAPTERDLDGKRRSNRGSSSGGGFRGGGHGDGSVHGWEAPTERDLDGRRRSNRGSSSGGSSGGGTSDSGGGGGGGVSTASTQNSVASVELKIHRRRGRDRGRSPTPISRKRRASSSAHEYPAAALSPVAPTPATSTSTSMSTPPRPSSRPAAAENSKVSSSRGNPLQFLFPPQNFGGGDSGGGGGRSPFGTNPVQGFEGKNFGDSLLGGSGGGCGGGRGGDRGEHGECPMLDLPGSGRAQPGPPRGFSFAHSWNSPIGREDSGGRAEGVATGGASIFSPSTAVAEAIAAAAAAPIGVRFGRDVLKAFGRRERGGGGGSGSGGDALFSPNRVLPLTPSPLSLDRPGGCLMELW